ncbi:MAG: sugar phosphate isomerase/epimerase family protein [Planctomycetota bacterium]
MTRRIGVCSWSLRPRSPADLVDKVRACGLDAVQLALTPLCREVELLDSMLAALGESGIAVRSGMMSTIGEDYSTLETIRETGGLRPDALWEENLALARDVSRAAVRAGVPLVSFHAGFLPEARGSRERATMIARLRSVADVFAQAGVRIALETGQERAEVLLEVLAELERPSCGVNFDPANMILYDMDDPVEALAQLAPRIFQVHVKDARRTKAPGTWGEEVPVGQGQVDWQGFLRVVRDERVDVDWMIERESGDRRVEDVRAARALLTPSA